MVKLDTRELKIDICPRFVVKSWAYVLLEMYTPNYTKNPFKKRKNLGTEKIE